MNLKTRRMNHIFKEDGKALIVAMDHGTFNGAAPGLEHPGETLQQIAEGGADAVLCNFGVARKFAKELAPLGYIARLALQHTWARVMTADWYSMQNMRFAWEQMQLW